MLNSEVSAKVSCLAPWDVDDNQDDDTVTTYASKIPLVTYESSDLYWTAGISLLLVLLAYLGGVLKLQKPEPVVESKEKPVIQIDDISLGDDEDQVEPESEVINEQPTIEDSAPEVMVEEEVIDIDDGTASGRLSALRKEIGTDSDGTPESKDDISKRLDSFFANR